MKVTETTQRQDGSTAVREFNIPFQKGVSQISYTLIPETDDPISVHIMKSGWNDAGPLYHILVEYGDSMHTDYMFGNYEYVCEMFPEFIELSKESCKDVIVTSNEVRETFGNENELGRLVLAKSFSN